MMSVLGYREWLEEFIEIYRSEPCLWKVKSKDYQNRKMKDEAYARLVVKLREKEPNADREAVLKKINSLRCTYRKEVRKLLARSGGSGEETYEPKLWYYHLMEFLENQEESKTEVVEWDSSALQVCSMKTEDTAAEENNKNDISSTTRKSNTSTVSCSSSHNDLPCSSSRVNTAMAASSSFEIDPPTSTLRNYPSATTSPSLKRDFSEAFLEDSIPNLENEENFCDLFGKMISLKFRKISAGQRLLAEKIINEVLFDAQFGKLTIDHRLTKTPVSRNDRDMSNPSVYHCRDSEQYQIIHSVPYKVEEDFAEDFESLGE